MRSTSQVIIAIRESKDEMIGVRNRRSATKGHLIGLHQLADGYGRRSAQATVCGTTKQHEILRDVLVFLKSLLHVQHGLYSPPTDPFLFLDWRGEFTSNHQPPSLRLSTSHSEHASND